ncbi:hypothetical protein D7X99_12395 [Corallococcus sp. AB032C]|uniref:phage antirepressor n=1 Tax=Corallococcus TaxID=83461 RepID=UPI000EED278A|nr:MULTISPECIES: phage antirepressor KilAC domain-containing protein [Corallococcus]NPC47114.1 hypothetical protein [Corallococcus exiguus]RKH83638.1 hypothetical protein D7X99_12395 [Corallococcus sp. AB032C]
MACPPTSIAKVFEFESHRVRTVIGPDGEPWFVAKDVAEALEYRMASDLTRMLAEDEQGTHVVRTLGGEQEMTAVSEPGVYRAIFAAKPKSEDKAEKVERFRRWVTHEVLPAIRKTGSYAWRGPTALAEEEPLLGMAKRFLDTRESWRLKDAARLLRLPERKFFAWLPRDKVVFREFKGGPWVPYAPFREKGLLVFVPRVTAPRCPRQQPRAYGQTRVTAAGFEWLSRQYGHLAAPIRAQGELFGSMVGLARRPTHHSTLRAST